MCQRSLQRGRFCVSDAFPAPGCEKVKETRLFQGRWGEGAGGDPAGEGEPAKEIAESWGRWSYLLCLSLTGLRVNLYYLLVSIKLKPHLLFSASGPDRLFFSSEGCLQIGLIGSFPRSL